MFSAEIRPAILSNIGSLFARSGADLGWEPAAGEDDERRLRRAAVLRALVLVARDPAVAADAVEVARNQGHGEEGLVRDGAGCEHRVERRHDARVEPHQRAAKRLSLHVGMRTAERGNHDDPTVR